MRVRASSRSSSSALRLVLSTLASPKGLLSLGALMLLSMTYTVSVQLSMGPTARADVKLVVRRVRVGELEDVATELYPESIFSTDWRTKVSDEEILHLGALHGGCMQHKDSIVPWNYGLEGETVTLLGNETDPNILERLRQCPDVDVFIPGGIRGHGYCEDAVAYTKCTSYAFDCRPPRERH
ncbi:hypothetical protein P43SY_007232 [Pythium insidiosum]|uniref:Uncharacterized protein n=1 Tax=Pythium insidiosum TaxID=114742 RepID=A0AAD5Q4V0_PYTIN|nr:hypothetical protein P43SY_007232 [Pythium insidiosum]